MYARFSTKPEAFIVKENDFAAIAFWSKAKDFCPKVGAKVPLTFI